MTMVEREKKLLRMNTVPIMENVASLQKAKSLKTPLPTIEMEETSPCDNTTVYNESYNV